MTITSSGLVRASGVSAVVAGVLFVGVQIGHPEVDLDAITTTDMYIRDQVKVLMSVLALVGITGMYLSQIRRNGVLGLIGYALFAIGYLLILCDVYVTTFVLPEVAGSDPRYVSDLIAIGTGRGTVEGDVGAMETLSQLRGLAYLAGGLLFGIALFRARVLARWAAALLAVGGIVSIALSQMPDAFYRLLAVPNAIALIGLGYSLWRTSSAPTDAAEAMNAARAPDPDHPAAR